jgi:hypothetical protein
MAITQITLPNGITLETTADPASLLGQLMTTTAPVPAPVAPTLPAAEPVAAAPAPKPMKLQIPTLDISTLASEPTPTLQSEPEPEPKQKRAMTPARLAGLEKARAARAAKRATETVATPEPTKRETVAKLQLAAERAGTQYNALPNVEAAQARKAAGKARKPMSEAQLAGLAKAREARAAKRAQTTNPQPPTTAAAVSERSEQPEPIRSAGTAPVVPTLAEPQKIRPDAALQSIGYSQPHWVFDMLCGATLSAERVMILETVRDITDGDDAARCVDNMTATANELGDVARKLADAGHVKLAEVAGAFGALYDRGIAMAEDRFAKLIG